MHRGLNWDVLNHILTKSFGHNIKEVSIFYGKTMY